jgi:hypothetical protein
LPEHCVWPGAQTPPQDADEELVVRQVPVAVHVDTPLRGLPASSAPHSLEPGAHTPWQLAEVPTATHAWLTQPTGGSHMPDESQIS